MAVAICNSWIAAPVELQELPNVFPLPHLPETNSHHFYGQH